MRGSSGGPRDAVLVVGPAYLDLVFGGLDALPEPGTERFARRFAVTAGGSAITAIALARLDRRVALAADAGDDAHGDLLRGMLEHEGVNVSLFRILPGTATPVTAVLSLPHDRAFVTHLPPAASPADLADAVSASRAAHVHVGGFPYATACPEVADVARSLGITSSFDPGWDEAALRDPRVLRVARDVDVLLPSRPEAAQLVDGPGAAGRSAEDLSKALAEVRGGRVTVVKDGAAGAVGAAGGEVVRVDGPRVTVVDATGAGDVFDAGFLDAWLGGAELHECLRRGAACGAIAVTAMGGATAAPTRAELDRRLGQPAAGDRR